MVAARHQDPQELATLYRDTKQIVLTIDGLQPLFAAKTAELQSFSNDKTYTDMAKMMRNPCQAPKNP